MNTPTINILIVLFFIISTNSVALGMDSQNEIKDTYTLADVMELSQEQQDILSCCGPLSLARCLAVLGKEVDFNTLRCSFKTKSVKGVELSELLEVSKEYYPESCAIRVSQDSLQSLPLPAILIVDDGKHCLVLEDVTSDKEIAIWDPRNLKKRSMSKEQLGRIWNGETILFSPIRTSFWNSVLLGGLSCMNLVLLWCLCQSRKANKQQPSSSVQK